MTTNASVKVDSSRRTSAPGVLLDQLVPAVFKMTSSERTLRGGLRAPQISAFEHGHQLAARGASDDRRALI